MTKTKILNLLIATPTIILTILLCFALLHANVFVVYLAAYTAFVSAISLAATITNK